MDTTHAADKPTSVEVFLVRGPDDLALTPIGTFTHEMAGQIAQSVTEGLRGDNITEIRWPEYIAERIMERPRFDSAATTMAVALAAIDRRLLGRMEFDEVTEILVRHGDGSIALACVGDPAERDHARHSLFRPAPMPLAA